MVEVTPEEREAVKRAEAYAMSTATTPEECHDIMDTVRLAKRFMRRSPLRTETVELRAQLDAAVRKADQLEVAIGWFASVCAATADHAVMLKSTGRGERERQLLIMEKSIAILDGEMAPTRSAQNGVRSRCVSTRDALLATLTKLKEGKEHG